MEGLSAPEKFISVIHYISLEGALKYLGFLFNHFDGFFKFFGLLQKGVPTWGQWKFSWDYYWGIWGKF